MAEMVESEVTRLFGTGASIEPLSVDKCIGRRITGVDLASPLSPEQAEFVVSLLDHHPVISFPNQDKNGFCVHNLERLANHFGAPITHPKNYANYGARDEPLRVKDHAEQTFTQANQAFPGQIVCADGAESPAVYVITNLVGSGPTSEPVLSGGQHWHTDIEFEPVPLSTSMFFVQQMPLSRSRGTGTWVNNPPREPGFYHPGSPPT